MRLFDNLWIWAPLAIWSAVVPAWSVGAAQAPTSSEDPRIAEVTAALGRGDLGRAAKVVGEWIGSEPNHPEALQLRGRIEFTQGSRLRNAGQLPAARRYFQQASASYGLAARHAPELRRSSYHAWGYCLHALGKYPEAIDRLSRALGGSADADVWRLTSQCRRLVGQLELAQEAIERAIELNDGDVLLHLERAKILAARGRAAEAAESLESRARSFEGALNSSQREVLHWLFRHHLDREDLERARWPLDRLCAADPQWMAGRIERGILHYRRGDLSLAKKDLVAAVETGEPIKSYVRGRGHLHLGLIAQHEGDAETARERFEKTLTLAPNEAAALLGLVACSRRAGDRERARALARKARSAVELEEQIRRANVRLASRPRDRDAHRGRLQAVLQLERWEEARDLIQTFARELPGDPAIAELGKDLARREAAAKGKQP